MSGLDAVTVILAFAAGVAAGTVAWGVWLQLARRAAASRPTEAPAGATLSAPPNAVGGESPDPAPSPLAPPAPAARKRTRPSGELRISQRVIVHLSRQPRLAYGELAPFEVSQGGMTKVLHVAQPALAKVLRRLIDGGAVLELKQHVKGQPQRLKVYQLTAQGEAIARDLRSRIAAQRARMPSGSLGFDRDVGLEAATGEDDAPILPGHV
ncbi:MAG TPA: hypothetical protein VFF67_02650 [Thermoplasmata archaeon]|nr:hypothetical protein [Thermoplasmata archaeon]